MAADANWLATHSVTGLDFGTAPLPAHNLQASASNCPTDLSAVISHLRYQLHERRQFIPGPDPIVASLMFDLANATALTSTIEDSLPLYQSSLSLGYPHPTLLNLRVTSLQELSRHNWLSGWDYISLIMTVLVSIVVIPICLMIFFKIRRG